LIPTICNARSTVGESFAVNASPLIFLAQAGRLDFLRVAGETGVVPHAVIRELEVGAHIHDTARVVRETSWLTIAEAGETPESIRVWDLGDGESAVLAWAISHPGSEAVLDDLQARRCAATLGLPVRGTLGLVITAKQRGQIPAARPVIEELREAGMYLSDAILNLALKKIGE
jgi:predicted nucleic acid-binding protein